MAIISMGQITITDLNDAPVLNAYITSTQPTTQVYNNSAGTHTPSYATTPTTLQLNLTKAGSGVSILSDVVGNVVWKRKEGTAAETTPVGTGTAQATLTVNTNVDKDAGGARYTCSGTWADPTTGLQVSFMAEITLLCIQLAKASGVAVILFPTGDTFRNNAPATLTAQCTYYKDGAEVITAKDMRWAYLDSAATVLSGGHADFGDGWRLVTNTTVGTGNAWVSHAPGSVTVATTTLTVKPDLVVNTLPVACVVTEGGQQFKQVGTFRDMDDVIQMMIQAPEGDIIKNSSGTVNLLARLFRLGDEIDAYTSDGAATIYTYTWRKYDKNGVIQLPNPIKTGKTGAHKKLQVTNADVSVKATFFCEASE